MAKNSKKATNIALLVQKDLIYFSGNMDMAIAIRTMVMKQNIAYVQAGGGIVYDSMVEREYEETMNKARALLKAISQAEESDAILRRSHAVTD